MSTRMEVKPELLLWACERVGWSVEDAEERFAKFGAWIAADESQRVRPTLKQLEAFAKETRTPIGYFFLAEPPTDSVPIPDLRTIRDQEVLRASPNMLDTIHVCQQRQHWYRQNALIHGEEPLPFVGSIDARTPPATAAAKIAQALGFEVEARQAIRDWNEALRTFVAQAERLGVLVMVNGVVGSNTHRKLDPGEFRGFALVDDLAPLVFVNGADAKAAQMFTLAHELAHIWLGETALSDVSAQHESANRLEKWCNAVAAELLVPQAALMKKLAGLKGNPTAEDARQLARGFKVSSLVMLRRLHAVGALGREEMWALYREEQERVANLKARKDGGGDYYRTQKGRVSQLFAHAVCTSAWEGRESFTEAMRLLNIRKMETFRKFGASIGIDRDFGSEGAP